MHSLALIVLTAGIGLGVLTRFFDNQENALTWLGSLTAPWVLVAFGIGAAAPGHRKAILAATAAMVLGVVAYYAWMRLLEGGVNLSYFLSYTMLWLLLAPVAGAVFGLAGSVWQDASNTWIVRSIAVAVAAGVIAGESAFMAATSRELAPGDGLVLAGFILTGLALPGVLLDDKREKIAGYVMSGACLLLGIATVPLIRSLIGMLG